MTSERLSHLHLLPPRPTSAWDTNPIHPAASVIERPGQSNVHIEAPLFWYDPPWIRLPLEVAGRLAASVANLDVIVSALISDLSDRDDEPGELFQPIPVDEDDPAADTPEFLPRMTPYRAERYGFSSADFSNTQVVDVRLSALPDESGRLAYSPEQMKRWERTGDGSPIAGGGYVASGAFPTDVVSLKQAQVKLDQLRLLAPSAAIFVSIGCYALEEEVTAALVSKPDGIIVRMNQSEIEGLQLAGLVRSARRLMNENGGADLPLWIVPGEVVPRDVAKLIALGASAVAIDAWCNPLVDFLVESVENAGIDRAALDEIPAVASQQLWDDIDHVLGLVSAITPNAPPIEKLATFHPRWAKAAGVALLSP